ncbi:transglutaminase-like domain-containing protein [Bdellovibrio sp. GT3]|uniref:transglutaminase-like domain-containing protein n=1 Tax=Bdellovibrio sp. GT3 TaxID=3136282 RepID=UPI0030F21C85
MIKILCFGLTTLFATACLAIPGNLDGYTEQRGGFIQLPFGSYIEGSARHGGIQPDYQILDDDQELKKFLTELMKQAQENSEIQNAEKRGNFLKAKYLKIQLTTEAIRSALPGKAYDARPYRETLKEHRLLNKDISLGAYLQCKSGVCRENALLTHQALRALGIESHFVYVKVHAGKSVEDHALVVIKDGNKTWMIDPYNATFHGRDFYESMEKSAWSRIPPSLAPFSNGSNYVGRILKVLKYPSYWTPNNAQCKNVFL